MAANRTLQTRLNLTLRTEHRDNTKDYGGETTAENIPLDDFTEKIVQSLAFGDGDEEANLVWHDVMRVTGNVDLDLAGVMIDKFGGTLTFSHVKALVFYNHDDTNPVNVLGTAAANQEFDSFRAAATATEPVILQPGGAWMIWAPNAGYAVGAGASDLIRLAAGANTVYVDIVVVGIGTRVEDEPTTTTTATTTTATTTTATTTTAAPTTTTAAPTTTTT